MLNIWLFLSSVACFFIFQVLREIYSGKRRLREFKIFESKKTLLKNLVIFVILCLPVNINGYVFTIAGSAVGEKGVYSLLSFYQEVEENGLAFNIFSLGGVQVAEKGLALTLLGFPLFQYGEVVSLGVGATLCQKSKEFSGVLLGVPITQFSDGLARIVVGATFLQQGKKAEILSGLVFWQHGQEDARIGVGAAVVQKASVEARIHFGAAMFQLSGYMAGVSYGGVSYQKALKRAEVKLALAILQVAGKKERSFTVYSVLESDSK
ncbi:MAG TPA: hypothetical protein VI978_01840 [Candidatus Paceibacterota bacterium]